MRKEQITFCPGIRVCNNPETPDAPRTNVKFFNPSFQQPGLAVFLQKHAFATCADSGFKVCQWRSPMMGGRLARHCPAPSRREVTRHAIGQPYPASPHSGCWVVGIGCTGPLDLMLLTCGAPTTTSSINWFLAWHTSTTTAFFDVSFVTYQGSLEST